MSDESMSGKHIDEQRTNLSRRSFLQGAVVAVGAAGFGFTSKAITDKTVIPGTTIEGCDCLNEAAMQVMAAAVVGGKYFAFAGTESGPQLFSLNIGRERQVSFGEPVKLDLPENFTFGSIGVARGGLIMSGGLPFVLETMEVDYELTEDVRVAMDNDIPKGIPTSGRRRVDRTGIEPAVFMINRQYAEQLTLPAMPKRSFAIGTAISETADGGMALLIEHSDGVNESYFASAVDVIEEQGSDWKTWNAGRNLGESGPNYLASGGENLVCAINTADGSSLLISKQGQAAFSATGRIQTLIPGHENVTAITKDRTGALVWSSMASDGRLVAGPAAEIHNDEVVGAAAVVGAKGQVILLGRRSTVLVENIPAYLSRVKGGDRYVM